MGLWDSCGRLNDPLLARQACVRGKRDDHLGRLMITWVGERFNPSLARQACVQGIRDDQLGRLMINWVGKVKLSLVRRACVSENEMITWVCGTVGLWDSCGRLNDPSLARQACVPKIEMIMWVCGTVGLGE